VQISTHNISKLTTFVLVLTSAFSSVAFPLGTYALTLAMFGLPHVLMELRYVDTRFCKRLGSTLRQRILLLLFAILSIRSMQVFGVISSQLSIPLELSCVACLVVLVVPVFASKNWRLAILGVVLLILLTAGIFFAPTLTLLFFAVFHNITPVGFIAEKLRGSQRRSALWVCFLIFAVIPLIILSGLPYQLLSSFGLTALQASILNVGNLDSHLGVFIPTPLHTEVIAIHAFSAAVFLQCMHYAVVIGIFSRWNTYTELQKSDSFFWWLSMEHFYKFVLFLSVLLFVSFIASFRDARAIYGIAAAIHAWVEIPILLLTLAIPASE
jgi:hypothetical protein